MNCKELFMWSGVVVDIVAAGLWFASTRVKISYAKKVAEHQKVHGPDSSPGGIVGEDGSDFYGTVRRQSRWSGWAALATALGIALGAVATAMQNSN